jgi:hypothetical protein
MRKIVFIIALIAAGVSFRAGAQTSGAVVTTIPANFTAVDQVKIIVDVSAVGNLVNQEPLYVWTWHPNEPAPGNGSWDNSNEARKMVKEGPNKWSWTIKPTDFYGVVPAAITMIQFLVKAKNGNGDLKTNDITLNVAPLIFTPTDFRTFPSVAGQNEVMKVYFDQKLVTNDVTTERMTPVSADITLYDGANVLVGTLVNKPVQALGNRVYVFSVLPRADFVIPAGVLVNKMRVVYKGTMLDPNGTTINVSSQPYDKLFDDLK